MFCDLNQHHGEAVQANQFLIVNDDTGAIIDPGGNLAYSELYLGMTLDRASGRVVMMASTEGGMDIEKVAEESVLPEPTTTASETVVTESKTGLPNSSRT